MLFIVPCLTEATFAKARAMDNNQEGCFGCLNGHYGAVDTFSFAAFAPWLPAEIDSLRFVSCPDVLFCTKSGSVCPSS